MTVKREVVVVSAVRTPIGTFLGGLSSLSATKLGSIVIDEALRRAGIEKEMADEVIMGNVIQAGQGQNIARQVSIYAGIPKEANAFTVNKVCASGMKSVALAAQAIRAGDAEVIIAGGTENMSCVPYYLPTARWGARMFNTELVDGMVNDGLWEIFYNYIWV